jgi:hypothetical protein
MSSFLPHPVALKPRRSTFDLLATCSPHARAVELALLLLIMLEDATVWLCVREHSCHLSIEQYERAGI